MRSELSRIVPQACRPQNRSRALVRPVVGAFALNATALMSAVRPGQETDGLLAAVSRDFRHLVYVGRVHWVPGRISDGRADGTLSVANLLWGRLDVFDVEGEELLPGERLWAFHCPQVSHLAEVPEVVTSTLYHRLDDGLDDGSGFLCRRCLERASGARMEVSRLRVLVSVEAAVENGRRECRRW
jgi:hypothetical protein